MLCDDDNGNLWEENTVKTELGNKCELEGGRVYTCMITAEGFNHDKTNIKVLKLDDRAMENKYELGSATANGTVTFTDENGNVIKEGYAGDRVYFSIKANEGYDANCFDVVNLATLDEIEYRKEGKGIYSFEMPDAEIFVDVVYLRNGDYDLPKLDEGVTFNCKFGETYRFTPETDGVYEFRAGDKEKTDLKITLYGWDVETNKSEYGNYCTLKAGEMYKVSMTVNGADNDSMVPPFFIEKVASHEITIANVKHGKIEVTFAEGADGKVDFNTPVSVKFIPDKGYKLKNAYLDCYDSVTKIKPDKNGVYEFSMPNSDVELGAVFQKTNKK